MPSESSALSAHNGIALGGVQESYTWRLRDGQQADQVVVVPFTPSLVSDDMATLKAAACAGLGIVALPGYVGSGEVERGQLVRVLPQWIAGPATMNVLMPSRRGLLPSVSAFVEFLAEHVRGATDATKRRDSFCSLAATGLATSIDAMAVGVGLAFLDVNIVVVALVIGLTTLVMVTLGSMLGRVLGSLAGKRAEIVGGLMLIAIRTAILSEHLSP